jgi:hypothetical protein
VSHRVTQLVLVVDGLRPDLIDRVTTPTIARLRDEGVLCVPAHAALPSVTRVNGAAIVTGQKPGITGLVGNEIYAPAIASGEPVRTSDGQGLLRLARSSGSLLACPSLASRAHAAGARFVSVGSGSSGSALLLNADANAGHGVMINTDQPREGVPLAIPAAVEDEIVALLGPPPPKARGASYLDTMAYAASVIDRYVLPELRPDVLVVWVTEPDHSQHVFGLGSPEATRALSAADRTVARVLGSVTRNGRQDPNVLVLSDHGFSSVSGAIDVASELVRAGLKDDLRSNDVVVANTGMAAIHVRDRNAELIAAITRWLHSQPWAGVVFTAPERPGGGLGTGSVEGTFSTSWLGYAGGEREADVLVALPWSTRANRSGVEGDSVALVRHGQAGYAADHGNLAPHEIRSTMIGWGPAFAARRRSFVPAGNVDVTPTVLHLLGVAAPELDGRVLEELLRGVPPEVIGVPEPETVRLAVPGRARVATIGFSTVDDRRYLSWAGSGR